MKHQNKNIKKTDVEKNYQYTTSALLVWPYVD